MCEGRNLSFAYMTLHILGLFSVLQDNAAVRRDDWKRSCCQEQSINILKKGGNINEHQKHR